MKIGQKVTLVDGVGERHTTTVVAVPGTGKSGFKTLTLMHKGETIADIPHGNDRVPGEWYWLLPHEKDVEPEPEPPKTKAKKAKKK